MGKFFLEKFLIFLWALRDLNIPLTDKNLNLLHEVTATIFGEEKANEATNYAKELGYIHPVQRYFGLHYVAHELRKGNQDFLNSLRSSGYEWLDRDF